LVPLVLVGVVGYLLGGWHLTGLRNTGLSASQIVALRFPEDWDSDQEAAPTTTADAAPSSGTIAQVSAGPSTNSVISGDVDIGLLSPQPMVTEMSGPPAGAAPTTAAVDPQSLAAQSIPTPVISQPAAEQSAPAQTVAFQALVPQMPAQQASVPQAPVQVASIEQISGAAPLLASARPAAELPRESKTAPMVHIIKPPAPPINRRAERPGFVLNDAQIASIRRRLNLTPDQERMWPAVEAALRNLAYTTGHEAHRRGSTGFPAQLASADPNSAEVQDLKSAAIPLIMSFNSEQKDEVRSLAHVMGLDQLASQF
jgi:hypothetical protein